MDLKDYIESIPGFPKEGIIFRDVTPILQNASAMRYCVDQLNDFVKSVGADVVKKMLALYLIESLESFQEKP